MINFIMNNGLDIPAIGYGVFMMSSVEIEQHLPEAIETGYRHIDTANSYLCICKSAYIKFFFQTKS